MGSTNDTTPKPNRRDFLAQAMGLGALLSTPARLLAQERLPTRTIPGTGEAIPVIGFGSSKPVLESPREGTEPIANVLRTLLEYGGRVIDTSPRTEEIDREFGRVLQDPEVRTGFFSQPRSTSTANRTASISGAKPRDCSGAARWICSRSRVYEMLTCTGPTSGPGRTPGRLATSV